MGDESDGQNPADLAGMVHLFKTTRYIHVELLSLASVLLSLMSSSLSKQSKKEPLAFKICGMSFHNI